MTREDESKKAEQELQKLRKLPENRRCANCLAPGAPLLTAVVMPFRIFVCSNCKSAHQSFSHRCKSTQMSLWTIEEVRSLEEQRGGGNRVARDRWLRHVQDSQRPRDGDRDERFKEFVRRAYVEKRWAAEGSDREESSRGDRVKDDRREDDRHRGGGGQSSRGRPAEDSFFDPDFGRNGGAVRQANLLDHDQAPGGSGSRAGAELPFNPDRGNTRSHTQANGALGSSALVGFDPDASAPFDPNAPAASSGTSFGAFESAGPPPSQPWAPAAGFNPLVPGTAAAPATTGFDDLFDPFVSASPAAAPQMQSQQMGSLQSAGGCSMAAAAPQSGPAAWCGASPANMAAMHGAGNAMHGPAMGAAAMQMGGGASSAPFSQGQWPLAPGSGAFGSAVGAAQSSMPAPAAAFGLQPNVAAAAGWQTQAFGGSTAAWQGGSAAQFFGGVAAPGAQQWGQQQQQVAAGGWQQPCTPWPATAQPTPAPAAPQPVRLEDLKQNLQQLYATA